MKRRQIGKASIILILFSIVAVILGGMGQKTSVSWANFYESIDDLNKKADLVVQCSVTDITSYKEYQKTDSIVRIWYIIYTNYTMKPINIIKGSLKEDKFLVHQTGGILNGEKQGIEDDPLLEKDVELILFLKEYAQNEYFIMGGPQGQFHVIDGKVYSVGELYDSARISTNHLAVKGSELDEFTKSLGGT